MLDMSSQSRRATHAERGDDLYETPPVAVDALIRCEPMLQTPKRIWEPACGRGAIVRKLEENGHEVVASDLIDYGLKGQMVRDFFDFYDPEAQVIVTNPPFKHANSFVSQALLLCPVVFMLLRLAFMESERRWDILEGRGLARVHVFRKRLPMMLRDGWEGRKANCGMAFAWFVWEREHKGPTIIDRISWDR